MNRNNYNGKKKEKKTPDDDGVDELLRAAQDDILLNLSLNSHIARATSSSSSLDPDLDSRFQALKSHKSKSNLDSSSGRIASEAKTPEIAFHKFDESDDLFARFAALKGSSIPSSHSNEMRRQLVADDGDGNGKEEEDDEVEKVIKWAMDAARLDPSPPSDSDTDDDDGYSDDTDDDDGVDRHKVDRTKSKRK